MNSPMFLHYGKVKISILLNDIRYIDIIHTSQRKAYSRKKMDISRCKIQENWDVLNLDPQLAIIRTDSTVLIAARMA